MPHDAAFRCIYIIYNHLHNFAYLSHTFLLFFTYFLFPFNLFITSTESNTSLCSPWHHSLWGDFPRCQGSRCYLYRTPAKHLAFQARPTTSWDTKLRHLTPIFCQNRKGTDCASLESLFFLFGYVFGLGVVFLEFSMVSYDSLCFPVVFIVF